MKTLISIIILMCATLLIGCGVTPVDISNASSEADLDRHVGQTVAFTGRYMPTKQLAISNGKVWIEVYRTGTFEIERDTTVTGVLKKNVVAPLPPEQDPMVQRIPPGVHYFIE